MYKIISLSSYKMLDCKHMFRGKRISESFPVHERYYVTWYNEVFIWPYICRQIVHNPTSMSLFHIFNYHNHGMIIITTNIRNEPDRSSNKSCITFVQCVITSTTCFMLSEKHHYTDKHTHKNSSRLHTPGTHPFQHTHTP